MKIYPWFDYKRIFRVHRINRNKSELNLEAYNPALQKILQSNLFKQFSLPHRKFWAYLRCVDSCLCFAETISFLLGLITASESPHKKALISALECVTTKTKPISHLCIQVIRSYYIIDTQTAFWRPSDNNRSWHWFFFTI